MSEPLGISLPHIYFTQENPSVPCSPNTDAVGYLGFLNDGKARISNSDQTDFDALIFGPDDGSSFEIHRNGTTFEVKLSDDSDYAPFKSSDGIFTGEIYAGSSVTQLTDSVGKILSAALNTVQVINGGTGLTTIGSGKLIYASDSDTFHDLSLGSTLSISSHTMDVIDNTSNQKIVICKNGGGVIGTRHKLNFIEGTNTSLTISDDNTNDKIDITITSTATGGGGGGLTGAGTNGYLTKWTGASSLGTSIITDDGSSIVTIPVANALFRVGTITGTSTATPAVISLGGSYSNTPGSHNKLKLYDTGSGDGMGFGVSSGALEINPGAGNDTVFYEGTTEVARFTSTKRLGIGTSPSSGSIDLLYSGTTFGINILNDSEDSNASNLQLGFNGNSTSYLRIGSFASVGTSGYSDLDNSCFIYSTDKKLSFFANGLVLGAQQRPDGKWYFPKGVGLKGNTNPSYALDIIGSAGLDGINLLSHGSVDDAAFLSVKLDSTHYMKLQSAGTSYGSAPYTGYNSFINAGHTFKFFDATSGDKEVFNIDNSGNFNFDPNASGFLMTFGGTTSSDVALKKGTGTVLAVRLGDNSADADLSANDITLTGDLEMATGSAVIGNVIYAGSGSVALNDAGGHILSSALNTVQPAQGGTGVNNGSSTITLAGNLVTTGAHSITFASTATTSVTLPTTGTLATLTGTEALSNKTISSSTIDNSNSITVQDNSFAIQDNVDNTKILNFQLSSITTGTTRTITVLDADIKLPIFSQF